LALLLHCIEHYYQPKSNFAQIDLETLERAITLSDYYCGQMRLLQAASLSGDEFPVDGLLFKIWEKVKALGRMSTRDVCQFARRHKWHGKKITAGSALEILTTIHQAGYGVLRDKTLYFNPSGDLPPDDGGVVDHVDQTLINDQQGEPHKGSEVQGNVDHVDQKSDLDEATPTDVTNCVIPSLDVSSTVLSTYCEDQPDQQIAEKQENQGVQVVDQVPTFDQHDQQPERGEEMTEPQQDALQTPRETQVEGKPKQKPLVFDFTRSKSSTPAQLKEYPLRRFKFVGDDYLFPQKLTDSNGNRVSVTFKKGMIFKETKHNTCNPHVWSYFTVADSDYQEFMLNLTSLFEEI
jgi:hypothetical protein